MSFSKSGEQEGKAGPAWGLVRWEVGGYDKGVGGRM
jgi:hypothetical protein